jgi:hypothetical protein
MFAKNPGGKRVKGIKRRNRNRDDREKKRQRLSLRLDKEAREWPVAVEYRQIYLARLQGAFACAHCPLRASPLFVCVVLQSPQWARMSGKAVHPGLRVDVDIAAAGRA